MWLATFSMAFSASARSNGKNQDFKREKTDSAAFYLKDVSVLTGEVVVLLAVCVGKGDQLPQQQGVLQHPLHRFNQVRLQRGRVLLRRVPCVQKFFKGLISLSFKKTDKKTIFKKIQCTILSFIGWSLDVFIKLIKINLCQRRIMVQ